MSLDRGLDLGCSFQISLFQVSCIKSWNRGVFKIRGLGWSNSQIEPHILGISPTHVLYLPKNEAKFIMNQIYIDHEA
jgi:hypothetical protein